MKTFLKGLVEMLAATAYSELGDSGYEWQDDIEVNSAPDSARLACQVPASV